MTEYRLWILQETAIIFKTVGNVVGTASRLGAGQSGICIPVVYDIFLSSKMSKSSVTHPASYSMRNAVPLQE